MPPKLSLALDEPADSDEILTALGYTFVVNKGLLAKAQSFTVDMSYQGFHVSSAAPVASGQWREACSTA